MKRILIALLAVLIFVPASEASTKKQLRNEVAALKSKLAARNATIGVLKVENDDLRGKVAGYVDAPPCPVAPVVPVDAYLASLSAAELWPYLDLIASRFTPIDPESVDAHVEYEIDALTDDYGTLLGFYHNNMDVVNEPLPPETE